MRAFFTGTALGVIAGMYMADRRSLANLQSKLQVAGNVMQDVMGQAKNKVMDSAMTNLANVGNALSKAASQANPNEFSLDKVKQLIDSDPEVKRKVDAILSENGLAPLPSSMNSTAAATSAQDALKTTVQSLETKADMQQPARH
ncbi:DNA-directed RNA polymerase [Paenibacillus melissococcoides]|uniref:DNA-directed RNA polymerase n=1 Tax=Paenibacillus melissococcoides TaxID=2912268 RepID=A0ABN8U3J4_9BACL|nr:MULTISPECIES: DNA-directed RNA polymerase [Paenibacillus]MEB9895564.1 DNA-directed RNA polymerase [Bacillus cereus]CAH8245625.1 DNA-directed RNA polymerase [Paenibacillus melissococcoides]CAH8711504.1 DNA-directed RNA polymerase [Paenibacillus melissococcoides]CAH8712269.1 DNA-directed RNA polymerase [Paenibacillus melissococcoides]